MKFIIEFSGNNLIKFRHFIYKCNKIFTKTGIIMTVIEDSKIRVAPDPYNISDRFQHDTCATDSIKIYKYAIFVEYPLIKANENSQKNATYNKLELKITKRDNPNINIIESEDKVLSFRITLDQLKKLNELLQGSFSTSETIILKAEKLDELTNTTNNKLKEQNYSKACLSISNNQKNSTKSIILFKILKRHYIITDYEDDVEIEDGENQLLEKFIYSGKVMTKKTKKFAMLAQKNFNKFINLYLYKENDKKEKTIKNHLFFSYLSNYIYYGKYIHNEKIDPEEFKIIYKIQINSEVLTKVLRNFNSDPNNPDYLSVYSKGLVFKTNYKLRYNFDDKEKNNGENNIHNSQNEDESIEEDREYMKIKAIIIFDKNTEMLNFEGINLDDGWEKKKYVLNIIENDIDDKHEELNMSLDLSDVDDEVVYRRNNSLIDEDEDDNNNEDEEENISEIINKKKEEKKKRKSSVKKND